MLKFELIENYKHAIKILLRRKNLWFLCRTNHNTNSLALMPEKNSAKQESVGILNKKDKFQILTIITELKIDIRNKLKRFEFEQRKLN